MSSPGQTPDFAARFMDDYFAEADEHIVAIRRSLLLLEAALGGDLPPATLDDVFRSVHSLKGLSAMVELREAEVLAHHMESCLRGVREGDVTLTSVNFEALVDGAKVLEAVIVAHRHAKPLPAVGRILEQLEMLTDTKAARSGAGEMGGTRRTPAVPVVSSRGAPVWKVTFVPSPDLVERGVKVDSIRSRLLQIGQVLKVEPKVVSGGGISFEFHVRTAQGEQLGEWRDDGVASELLSMDAAAEPEIARGVQHGDVALDASATLSRPADAATSAPTNFVRVDLSRLDDLMRLAGDMVVTRARLDDTLQRVERHVPFQEWRALQDHNAAMERQLRDLREGVMRVRLVPVGEIFRRMPFVVRDLARDSGRRVQLELVGQNTEIDKFLIERMMDPVLHLVRNAISHAIEPPEDRIAAGKAPEGTIRLGASTAGESVVVEVADDGRGIDLHGVADRARAAGMIVPEGAIDPRGLLDIICASGFSTRDEVDRGSGRGVGMAVVRSTVHDLGGTLAVETETGRGTTFRITLPLTLAITDAIIAHVGDQTFAVPQSGVREVIEVEPTALRAIERNELVPYRGGALPIVRLADLFAIRVEPRPRLHAIVVGDSLAAVGLLVDRISGQREIVVKTISDPLIRVAGVSGATELGDGRPILILDVPALGRALRDHGPRASRVSA